MAVAVVFEGKVIYCTPSAWTAGVRPGDSLAQARAARATLEVLPLEPDADRAALRALAEAMLALAPTVEITPPDTPLLDASAAHLVPGRPGAEAEVWLAEQVRAFASDLGYRCRIAVVSGCGPTRALARHGRTLLQHVPPRETALALAVHFEAVGQLATELVAQAGRVAAAASTGRLTPSSVPVA